VADLVEGPSPPILGKKKKKKEKKHRRKKSQQAKQNKTTPLAPLLQGLDPPLQSLEAVV